MKTSILLSAWAIAAFTAILVGASVQSPQPYSGMQSRQIKALSDQQIADLKAGRGMGLALAAELNDYPGPSHLVELSDQIGLTSDQLFKLKAMFDAMRAETIPIGETLIAQEERLDQFFAGHAISAQQLEAATKDIGETQARLRNAHLSYHLRSRAILEPSQIRRYAEFRGYGGTQERMLYQHNHE